MTALWTSEEVIARDKSYNTVKWYPAIIHRGEKFTGGEAWGKMQRLCSLRWENYIEIHWRGVYTLERAINSTSKQRRNEGSVLCITYIYLYVCAALDSDTFRICYASKRNITFAQLLRKKSVLDEIFQFNSAHVERGKKAIASVASRGLRDFRRILRKCCHFANCAINIHQLRFLRNCFFGDSLLRSNHLNILSIPAWFYVLGTLL